MNDSSLDRINISNLAYIEERYLQFLKDPNGTPQEWCEFFDALEKEEPDFSPQYRKRPRFHPPRLFNPDDGRIVLDRTLSGKTADADLQLRVDKLVRSYRVRGHLHARLDPLERPRSKIPELDPDFHGITERDLDRTVSAETLYTDQELRVRDVLEWLQNTYSCSIGVQYMHIDDHRMKEWLMERMERSQNHLEVSQEAQWRILTKLTDAVVFEEFIQKKYLGAKSFFPGGKRDSDTTPGSCHR